MFRNSCQNDVFVIYTIFNIYKHINNTIVNIYKFEIMTTLRKHTHIWHDITLNTTRFLTWCRNAGRMNTLTSRCLSAARRRCRNRRWVIYTQSTLRRCTKKRIQVQCRPRCRLRCVDLGVVSRGSPLWRFIPGGTVYFVSTEELKYTLYSESRLLIFTI